MRKSADGSGRDGFELVRGHRYAYELLIGPIPDGLVIDHLCRNRRCLNPWHMEPVTRGDNVRRGQPGIKNKQKTHCPRGHEYIAENTWRNKRGGRFCVACRREWWHRVGKHRRTEKRRQRLA